MRFLVITDLHQKRSRIERINDIISDREVEFVLFLGDVTDMGSGDEAADIISMIRSKVYVIPGNCDARDMPEIIGRVATDMHGKSVNIDGYDIVGLGGSNITIFDTPFELTEEEIDFKLRPISKKGMILMTHAPSYGILDEIPSGLNVGSPAIKRIVDDFKPILALSGHIHEAIGIRESNGTVFCNPGPAKDGHCAFVEIDKGAISVELIGPMD